MTRRFLLRCPNGHDARAHEEQITIDMAPPHAPASVWFPCDTCEHDVNAALSEAGKANLLAALDA